MRHWPCAIRYQHSSERRYNTTNVINQTTKNHKCKKQQIRPMLIVNLHTLFHNHIPDNFKKFSYNIKILECKNNNRTMFMPNIPKTNFLLAGAIYLALSVHTNFVFEQLNENLYNKLQNFYFFKGCGFNLWMFFTTNVLWFFTSRTLMQGL